MKTPENSWHMSPPQAKVTRLGSLLKISFGSVFSFRLQNVLVFITMAVGAFTLSSTLSIGDGALSHFWNELENLTGDWMIIHPDPGGSINVNNFDARRFSDDELKFLRLSVNAVKFIEPIFSGREILSYKHILTRVSVDGISGLMINEELFRPLAGGIFSAEALKGFSWECYLTTSLHKKMGSPPLDALYVRIDSSRFLVKAVTPDPPEADGIFRNRIVIPYSFAELLWGDRGKYQSLAVGWESIDASEKAIEQVGSALDMVRGPGSYIFSSSLFKLKKRKTIVDSFVVFGKTQALFCIFVASVGILNVMLANVVQKMREFAIRLTLGATRADIVILVLAEGILFSLAGAAMGVLLSVLLSPEICRIIVSFYKETQNLSPIVSLPSIVYPLVICSLCGLLAGILPAVRAIRIDILSILRAE